MAASATKNPSTGRKLISLTPETLELNLGQEQPTTTLTLRNHTDDTLAFKVKTTTPKRFVVKPNQELLLPNSSFTITIILKSNEAEALLATPPQEEKPHDRFMVSAVVVDKVFVNEVSEKRNVVPGSRNGLNQLFTAMWDSKDKSTFLSERARCIFVVPNNAKTPPGHNSTQKSSPGNTLVHSTPRTNVPTTNTTAATTGLSPISQIPPPSSTGKSGTSPSVTTTTTGNVGKTTSPIMDRSATENGNGGSSNTIDAQKYRDLLDLVVAITEERDRLQAQFREATKELALRTTRDYAAPVSNANVGNNGGTGNNGTQTSPIHPSRTLRKGGGGAGYQLWHLLIVAVVSFLVSRLLMLREDGTGMFGMQNLTGGKQGEGKMT